MSIVIKDVSKSFGSFQALDQINLSVEDGALLALLGPSGSGKSTLLRVMAGLESADQGSVWLDGVDTTHAPVQERQIGFVFQHYALFKHLTVRENIGFGLSIRKAPKKIIQAKVDELLELVQLKGLGERYPSQLSGGQRQRVALARSLAAEPKILFLDEPFGALDAKVRKELRAWLRRLHDEVHVTTIFVTHDQEEAMEVADTIVVMNKGKIEQVGTPADIYDRPASAFVMRFIGETNTVSNAKALFPFIEIPEENHVFFRPHEILIQAEPESDFTPAQVSQVSNLGWKGQAELILQDGQRLVVQLEREVFNLLQLQPKQKVFVKPTQPRAFPAVA
ncbi:sulfate ABC transporter, ATP-binding protein [Synechococcus sp. PCC 7502]|uniref:sulfate/molybdate ABC transporter ATP-binding protein n=1 Tax=Synechococcus sp. PCC 7502 TaxID=1173263 RepID=UPI00029FC63D|nr:sulfate/molybdate ABC transporter ATP-binding protein [Synechococcus sp. PCC 7502]AFY73720.1 sulfate ABC transporter, ATP-binding protein [Synechococcus sp. PCC 7502]